MRVRLPSVWLTAPWNFTKWMCSCEPQLLTCFMFPNTHESWGTLSSWLPTAASVCGRGTAGEQGVSQSPSADASVCWQLAFIQLGFEKCYDLFPELCDLPCTSAWSGEWSIGVLRPQLHDCLNSCQQPYSWEQQDTGESIFSCWGRLGKVRNWRQRRCPCFVVSDRTCHIFSMFCFWKQVPLYILHLICLLWNEDKLWLFFLPVNVTKLIELHKSSLEYVHPHTRRTAESHHKTAGSNSANRNLCNSAFAKLCPVMLRWYKWGQKLGL